MNEDHLALKEVKDLLGQLVCLDHPELRVVGDYLARKETKENQVPREALESQAELVFLD